MDMTGEYRIPAPRQRVWEALNDPAILKQAIPGCETLEKVGDNELEATVRAKVGPVSARFQGKVTLSDLNPPESYTISGEGKGGAAGFAKGGAAVRLTEDGDVTVLRYEAKADVGGKLAQIGSRLIQGTSKKMADDFFGHFSQIVAGAAAAPAEAAPAPAAPEEVPAVPPTAETLPPAEVPPGVAAPPKPPAPPKVEVPPSVGAPPPPSMPPRPLQPPAAQGGLSQSPLVWVGTIVVIIVVLFLLLRACS